MAAAMRLADVLLAREQRELAELKAAARNADKGETSAADTTPEPQPETAEEAARRFLDTVNGGTDE